jgi:hypothetical protein
LRRGRAVIPASPRLPASGRGLAPGRFPAILSGGAAVTSGTWTGTVHRHGDGLRAGHPGYCYPRSTRPSWAASGIIFSRPTALEAEVSELLTEWCRARRWSASSVGSRPTRRRCALQGLYRTQRVELRLSGLATPLPSPTPRIPASGAADLRPKYNDRPRWSGPDARNGQVAAVILDPVSGRSRSGFRRCQGPGSPARRPADL